MITDYVARALHRARYAPVEGGYCATVPGLRGVIATGDSLESCRDALVDVVEEWILVRVARGLPIPKLGGVQIQVKKAS